MNFIYLAFLDTLALTASLPSHMHLFPAADAFREIRLRENTERGWPLHAEEVDALREIRLREETERGWRLHPDYAKWNSLRNILSRVRHLPACKDFTLGAVRLEMLRPHGIVPWTPPAEGPEILHLALTTNPGAQMICGLEHLHLAPGYLYWINRRVPTTQCNFGEWPRIHLVIEAAKEAPESLAEDVVAPQDET